jgi:hypothetical protein
MSDNFGYVPEEGETLVSSDEVARTHSRNLSNARDQASNPAAKSPL